MPLYLTSRKCLVEVNGILGSKLIYLVKEKHEFFPGASTRKLPSIN